MDDVFHLIKLGDGLGVRLWLDSIENDFNQCDDHGFSLLHWACWEGRLSICEMLLNRGAKVNSVNKCEDTPLHCAVQNNHIDVVYCLIKNKANINAINIHGNQPLHYACHFNYTDLSVELIKLGAAINQSNRYEQTPIDLCRAPLRDLILSLAKNSNLDLTRIPFKEERESRWSQGKNKDLTFSCQNGINIDELPVEKMIDSNHGGTTWKGFWQSSEVVIKVLKVKETSQRIANSFNQECKRLRIFNSANILPVLGACVSLPDLIIVSQFMYYGSLYNVLHEQSELIIDLNQATSFAVHIAKGMEFLHSLEPMIPNFHLNSKHVMVDEDLVAKINMADYKFSFSDNHKIYDPAWMSPESLKKRPEEINKKSADMWSMGVILWELCTRDLPFAEYSPMQCGILITMESLRLQLPVGMSSQMQKLIRICMNEDPQKRPKFDMIIPILEKLKNNINNSK